MLRANERRELVDLEERIERIEERLERKYPIKADRLYEELYKKTKRWTCRGKPTKRARKLRVLEQGMAGILGLWW